MEFLRFLEGLRSPVLDEVMCWITQLGDETFFMIFALAVFWCVDKRRGYYLLTVGFVGTVLNQFLKLVFRVPRPWVLDKNFTAVEKALDGAEGYSFPSGHTQNIVGTMGSVARGSKSRAVRIVCTAVLLLVSFSRMYLGVHTPLDVGVSFGIALVLVFALYPLFAGEERPERMYGMFGVMAGLSLAYVIYVSFYPFPADVDADNLASGVKNAWTLLGAVLGVAAAYAADNRYTRFSANAPLTVQAVKLVLGLALTMALRIALKPLLRAVFGDRAFTDMIRYFVMVFFAGAVWPRTFKRLARTEKR